MFRSNDIGVLRDQIDKFDLPIFIVQRSEASIFPQTQAERIHSRYALCVEQAPPIRCRETLDLPCGLTAWETTLHHVLTHNGEHRVVGSATLFSGIHHDARDVAAFEDVRYFSSLSGWKLEQIVQILDAYAPCNTCAASRTTV